uniref:ARAD1A16236p n=1 Tax=Blastobotrys adeninivorans TaxID=409370 RepID=A0A060T3J8_BLAAD
MSPRPNYLVIVADDLGFSDVGSFGSEISTPNLDNLSKHGSRFTDFHTAAACSPTRSMLMSGTDHHLTGLGQLAEFVNRSRAHQGKPGHEGYLTERIATLPQVLQSGGYHTIMSGKWHLGLLPEYSPKARGFDKSFALLPGAANHYGWLPQLNDPEDIPGFLKATSYALHMEDGEYYDNSKLPEDFYSTNFYASKLIEYLENRPSDKPFFAYLPFSAPHWPLQAPPEFVEKYKGKYDDGPEVLRAKRLKRQVELGLISDEVVPHPVVPLGSSEWDKLTDLERQKSARSMEVYAAMVECMDYNIGRVFDYLKEQGLYDDTVVIFMSDNGAEGASLEAQPFIKGGLQEHLEKYYDNSLDNIGRKNSWVWYGPRWAQAATAPSRLFKMFSTEGGCRVPLIIKPPNGPREAIVTEFSTVMDLMPTFLDLAGVPKPQGTFQGREVLPIRGESWVPYLDGKTDHIHDQDYVIGWELVGQAALRKGKWKINFVAQPAGPQKWELFDLDQDPGETTDLAHQHPEKLEELIAHWEQYAKDSGVVGLVTDFERIIAEDEVKDIRKWMQVDFSYNIARKIKAPGVSPL